MLQGHYPAFDGVDALYSPRRTVLDHILVDAARSAGAEVRENFTVDELMMSDGRVTGIRGHLQGGTTVTETAGIVVGADGKHSKIAEAVAAGTYHTQPARSMACYTYWEGVPLGGGEMYGRDRRAVGVWPTNDGLAITSIAWPIAEYDEFRADVEGNALRTLDLMGDLGERVRGGTRGERFRLTRDLPSHFRTPHGPGWALVGDAGLVMDPLTGRGIGDAFRDAELLAHAIDAGLGGDQPLDEALACYQRARDQQALPMYEFTTELASFPPPRPEQQVLFTALAGNQTETDRFLGVITGAVPFADYMNPRNLRNIIGVRGFAKILWSKLRRPPIKQLPPEPVVAAREQREEDGSRRSGALHGVTRTTPLLLASPGSGRLPVVSASQRPGPGSPPARARPRPAAVPRLGARPLGSAQTGCSFIGRSRGGPGVAGVCGSSSSRCGAGCRAAADRATSFSWSIVESLRPSRSRLALGPHQGRSDQAA